MTSEVSVVIPARNAGLTLGEQLVALSESCPTDYEIIVVDNTSTDDTASVAARFVRVRLLSCPTRGANAARNLGIRASSGVKILLCDADDVVSSSWCAAMSAALESFDIVGGPLDWDTLNDPFVRTTRANPIVDHLPVALGFPSPISANLGFRRRVFDAVDGFDEEFLNNYDETDFCYRAHKQGCTIGFVPDAVVAFRLRSDARAAARQATSSIYGGAQFRAKHGMRQPWKSKVLRTIQHLWNVASVWRCVTRAGRFRYAKDVAAAGAALRGYRRYRIVGWSGP